MFKQAQILFGILLLALFTHTLSLTNDDKDKIGHENRQLVKAHGMSKKESSRARDLFDLNHLLKHQSRAFTNAQVKFQQEMLTAHNKYRQRHCVQSLQLDDSLSRSAQNYAEYLARIQTLVHSQTSGVGENLWGASYYNPAGINHGKEATDQWYNEVNSYWYSWPGFSYSTGHFTQVVWKGSTKLGAGLAFTADGRGSFVVAQYTPAGNMQGAFSQNVLRPNC